MLRTCFVCSKRFWSFRLKFEIVFITRKAMGNLRGLVPVFFFFFTFHWEDFSANPLPDTHLNRRRIPVRSWNGFFFLSKSINISPIVSYRISYGYRKRLMKFLSLHFSLQTFLHFFMFIIVHVFNFLKKKKSHVFKGLRLVQFQIKRKSRFQKYYPTVGTKISVIYKGLFW